MLPMRSSSATIRPQFTSDSLVEFLKLNGIKHSQSVPYHPATNVAVKWFVPVLKMSLKNKPCSLTVEHHLANFLRAYRRAVPQASAMHLPVYGEARTCDSDAPEASATTAGP